MDQWCRLEGRHIARGDFYEDHLLTISGLPFHDDAGFVEALAARMMQRYESAPVDAPLELPPGLIVAPDRRRSFYHRLFDAQGLHTIDFRTEASETLAEWVELCFGQALLTYRGLPHNSDPAFDVLSIVDQRGVLRLRVVQVKATPANLQQNCSVALNKFALLEHGHYDPQLNTVLALLARQRDAPPGLNLRELLFGRLYRVTVVHGEGRAGLEIMTTYDQKIPGANERRSGLLMQIDWEPFWARLGRRVYEQLA